MKTEAITFQYLFSTYVAF